MTTGDVGTSAREIPFSDADFRAIADLAQTEFGLNLAESKKPLVYSRLSKRLKARQVGSFQSYLTLLNQKEENAERLELISALTTNVTSFFREKHHFDMLRDEAIPRMIQNVKAGQRVRIWSAGCSSGQEPYSIAMTLLEKIPDAARHNVKILATDIDPKIVERARNGQYPLEEATGIPDTMRKAQVVPVADQDFRIGEEPRKLITFAELNLMDAWPFKGPFDAIFCRNVAIYFNQETQQRLWERFREMLVPDGFLFIGHSERVTGPATHSLSGVGITSYRNSGPGGRPTA
ncbi:CheR family methyltransferase [Sagittula salina]|uniref:Chemotaxis protein methyltransferase n=1 Tax=Sagittula salina TaxID=2820268 RepID=A0A940ML72_9RHOB|nr:protein-glutamate O-methyltransferase [Sagittula salina]MBP0481389.1 protein-glutamate O-methyltransferase [Sagittula salina]